MFFSFNTGSRVGADPTLIGAQTWLELKEELEEAGLTLVSLSVNLIDIIWTEENGRPPFSVSGEYHRSYICGYAIGVAVSNAVVDLCTF